MGDISCVGLFPQMKALYTLLCADPVIPPSAFSRAVLRWGSPDEFLLSEPSWPPPSVCSGLFANPGSLLRESLSPSLRVPSLFTSGKAAEPDPDKQYEGICEKAGRSGGWGREGGGIIRGSVGGLFCCPDPAIVPCG